jgi:hypothetical protein
VEEPVEEKSTVAPSLQQSASETPQAIDVGARTVNEESPWHALRLLVNKTWLRNTLILCRVFAPRCILPAVFLTVAGLALTSGQFYAFSQIHPEGMQLASILAAMGILLVTLIVVLVLLVLGFGLWLVRLSTFSHAFCALDMSSELPPLTEVRAIIASSHAFILSRKKYLARFYFMVSMVMITPIIVWLSLFTVKGLTMSPPNSGTMVTRISLPPFADLSLSVVLAIMGAFLVGFSFSAVVVSSCSKANANFAAWDCIKLSFRMFFPMMALVLVVVILNTVIATPQFLLHPIESISLMNTPTTLPASLCSELWEGITSVILFTLTLAPFCELLRNRLKSE